MLIVLNWNFIDLNNRAKGIIQQTVIQSNIVMPVLMKRHDLILLLCLFLFSCVSTEKVKNGYQAMDRKQYAVAIEYFQKDFKTAKPDEKAEIAFLLGECYRKVKQNENSLKWYLISADSGKKNEELFFQTGSMYKLTGQYDQAIRYFELSASKNNPFSLQAKREQDICRQALQWVSRNDGKLKAERLLPGTDQSMYVSGMDANGNLLISSEQNERGMAAKRHKWTGRPFLDLYQAKIEDPGNMTSFDEKLNSGFHEADLSINESNTALVFTRCMPKGYEENFCQLFTSVQVSQKWSEPVPLPFQTEDINYGHGHFSGDSLLFFSANDPAGKGGYDIYFVKKMKNGWGSPTSLPEPINTPGNEFYPVTVKDTLFYSSDFLPGLGGMDIFKTYPMLNGRWSPPQNLLLPYNSSADDFGFHTLGNSGPNSFHLINSNRNSQNGTDHIYRVLKAEIPERDSMVVSIDLQEPAKHYRLFLSLRVFEQVFEEADNPNSMVLGKKPVSKVEGLISGMEKNFSTDLNGRYITELSFDTDYTVILGKPSYITYFIELPAVPYPAPGTKLENHTVSREAIIKKIFLDKEITMEDIFYDLDKWDLRPDAMPALNGLWNTMVRNPDLKVLIGAHTDCRADDEYNMELSKKRAASVVNFLLEKGIASERISYEGYGETRLVEKCACEECTEEQHQKNRRTTLTLTK